MVINDSLEIEVDTQRSVLWIRGGSKDQLHYSLKTLSAFANGFPTIQEIVRKEKLNFLVQRSLNNEVWGMGGDLELFVSCVRSGNRDRLKEYGYTCIECVHDLDTSFGTDAVAISLVQGNAFGGGFESALAGNYLIAEEHARFSFPEALFGMFPGMGAFSFLTRKVGFNKAQEMIYSAKKWTAQEMKDLGLVHEVCKTGSGVETVKRMIDHGELVKPAYKISQISNRVSKQELLDIVDVWLDEVMQLKDDCLNFMSKVIDAQKKKADGQRSKTLHTQLEMRCASS
ncbi:MAG: crotonase/enoyl-CoA hydratase family protein [Chitinophagales bacterium]